MILYFGFNCIFYDFQASCLNTNYPEESKGPQQGWSRIERSSQSYFLSSQEGQGRKESSLRLLEPPMKTWQFRSQVSSFRRLNWLPKAVNSISFAQHLKRFHDKKSPLIVYWSLEVSTCRHNRKHQLTMYIRSTHSSCLPHRTGAVWICVVISAPSRTYTRYQRSLWMKKLPSGLSKWMNYSCCTVYILVVMFYAGEAPLSEMLAHLVRACMRSARVGMLQ